MDPVITKVGRIERLKAIKAALFTLANNVSPRVGLFTNDINPSEEVKLEDLVVPDSEGLALKPVAFDAPAYNDVGMAFTSSNKAVFQPTVDLGATLLVYGVFLLDNLNNVYAVHRFDQPQVIRTAYDVIKGVFHISEPLSNFAWQSVE